MNYYYLKDGENQGPFSLNELTSKNIKKDTLIWIEGTDNWEKAESIDELKEIFLKAEFISPPPPPPLFEIENLSQGQNIKQEKLVKQKRSFIYTFFRSIFYLFLLVVIVAGIYLFMNDKLDRNSIINLPETIDLVVDCSELESLLVATTAIVKVKNLSSRSHTSIKVKVTAYNRKNEVIKVKTTTFLRKLGGSSQFAKPITLPRKTKKCTCSIISSDAN